MKNLVKLTFIIAFVVALSCAGSVSRVEAYPLEVQGTVEVYGNSFVDNNDGTTSVALLYTFDVTGVDPGVAMDELWLEFEGDVFASVSIWGYNPQDWDGAWATSGSDGTTFELTSTAGTSLGIGETLTFHANVDVYNDALADVLYWDEGEIWSQSFVGLDNTMGGPFSGATFAPVPEPGTFALLGIGLIGLAGAGWRKQRNRNKKS